MKKGTPVLILGILFIAASLCLTLWFFLERQNGLRSADDALARIEAVLPEQSVGIVGVAADPAMPVLEVDGCDYVAVVEAPGYGVKLPVTNRWDSTRLNRTPARFSGSCYDGTMVIGGADSDGQFAFCKRIGHGDTVLVTNMTGSRFYYTVKRIDRSQTAGAQWLAEDEWDLTLFCRDSYSMEYIAVRCTYGR